MSLAAAVTQWHRGHLYKALVCLVLVLIALQYLLSGVFDRRAIETIFTINTTRYGERAYRGHPKGLIIYGPVTAATFNADEAAATSSPSASASRNLGGSEAAFSEDVNGTGDGSRRCPLVPPNLVGPVAVEECPPDLPTIEQLLTKVKSGGRGSPQECVARHRVAIVIPYRDRPQHLHALLYNLHPILLRQQIDYQIFVVEQEGNSQRLLDGNGRTREPR